MQQYHVIAKRIANPRQRVDVLVRGVGEKLLADPVTGLQRPGRFVDQPVHAIAGDNDVRLTARPDPPGNCAIGQTRDLVRDVPETAVEPAKPTGSSNVSPVANSSFVLSRSGSSGSSPSTSSLSPARRRAAFPCVASHRPGRICRLPGRSAPASPGRAQGGTNWARDSIESPFRSRWTWLRKPTDESVSRKPRLRWQWFSCAAIALRKAENVLSAPCRGLRLSRRVRLRPCGNR